MTIQQLQALDMSKVQPEALQTAVQDILNDYDATTDKKAFEDIAKENIEKVYSMVERLAPNAIKKGNKSAYSPIGPLPRMDNPRKIPVIKPFLSFFESSVKSL